jgi:hypothetical protein
MLLNRKPPVDFDPSNKLHRAAVKLFMKRRAWLDSPLRFTHDPAYGSVIEQVQTRLLEWYLARESFASKMSKPQTKSDIVIAFAERTSKPVVNVTLEKVA